MTALLDKFEKVVGSAASAADLWASEATLLMDALVAFAQVDCFLKADGSMMKRVLAANTDSFGASVGNLMDIFVAGWCTNFSPLLRFDVSVRDFVVQPRVLLFQEHFAIFLDKQSMNARWAPCCMDKLGVLKELHDLSKAIFDLPGVLEKVQTKRGFVLDDVERVQKVAAFERMTNTTPIWQTLGDCTAGTLQRYSGVFVSDNKQLAQGVKAFLEKAGSAKFKQLVDVWTSTVGAHKSKKKQPKKGPVLDTLEICSYMGPDGQVDVTIDKDFLEPLSQAKLDVDYILDLLAFADRCHDARLREQVSFFGALIDLASVIAKLALPLQEDDRESTKITQERVDSLKAMQNNIKVLTDMGTSLNPQASTKPLWGAEVGGIHYAVLDNFVKDPVGLIKQTTEQAMFLTRKYVEAWSDDVQRLTTAVTSFCPDGWQAQKDQLLQDSSKAVQKALLSNASYPKIGPAVSHLRGMTTLAKTLKVQDKPIISAEVCKAADVACLLGTETVTVTYSLYKVLAQLPKIVNVTVRKNAIKLLREDVKSKKVTLGSDLEKQLEDLESAEFKLPSS